MSYYLVLLDYLGLVAKSSHSSGEVTQGFSIFDAKWEELELAMLERLAVLLFERYLEGGVGGEGIMDVPGSGLF